MRSIFSVSVDGKDVTGNLTPFATSITVKDAAGSTSDTATIELADDDGRIALPRDGAKVEIALGWAGDAPVTVFTGVVDDLRSAGGRGQGRMLTISAKSADTRGKLKEPKEKNWDNKKLGEVMSDAGRDAGLSSVRVHPSLASIERAWWDMANESFMAFGSRLARELGATFKIAGDVAVMTPRSAGVSASDSPLAEIRAAWGDNLISWDLSPVLGRPTFKSYRVRWYDTRSARWREETVSAKTEDATAEAADRFPAPDGESAKKRAESLEREGDRDRGGGTVMIDGDPRAQAEASCVVAGIRPGIDGVYRIESVEHRYSRSEGFTSTLTLKQPSGEAGKDSRAKGAGS